MVRVAESETPALAGAMDTVDFKGEFNYAKPGKPGLIEATLPKARYSSPGLSHIRRSIGTPILYTSKFLLPWQYVL